MGLRVLHFGATGLIGKAFLDKIQQDNSFEKIIVLTRREIKEFQTAPLIEQHIIEFKFADELPLIPPSDIIVCTIGTTIKNAGSQTAFRKVDYDIPFKIAQDAFSKGAKYFILVSAVGANADSRIFYNRVKGELERDLAKIPFRGLHILRPSLLIGHRDEFRPGEKLAQVTASIYSVFLPAKLKPIKADTVASKIYSICRNPIEGLYFYEGRELQ